MIYWVLPAMVPHRTTLNRSYSMMYNLDTRILLVVEATVEAVTEYQYNHTLTLEVLQIVQLQVLRLATRRHQ